MQIGLDAVGYVGQHYLKMCEVSTEAFLKFEPFIHVFESKLFDQIRSSNFYLIASINSLQLEIVSSNI